MGSPPTATQLQCTQLGGPFKSVQVAKPTPGPNQILIHQKVVAFNLLDVKKRDKGIMVDSWPSVFGLEGAGVVEAVGMDVKLFKVGDEVLSFAQSSFTDYVVVGEGAVAKKPRTITFEEAASLPVCYITAVCAIVHALKIPLPYIECLSAEGSCPKSILVLGGSSCTGAAIIQLLRKAYPSLPILATSSAKHQAHLETLGATAVIDYNRSSTVSDINAASPNGAGVDVILDCVAAGSYQTDISSTLDTNGSRRYAFIQTGQEIPLPDDVVVIPTSGYDLFAIPGGLKVLPSMTELIEDGVYQVPMPVRVVGHGLEQIPDVLDEVQRVSGEKVVVTL